MDRLFELLLAPVLTAFAGAFSGWYFARRKQTAEAVQSELDSVEKAVAIWRTIAQDLQKELASQSEQISNLRAEVELLRQDNTRLLSELKAIKRQQKSTRLPKGENE